MLLVRTLRRPLPGGAEVKTERCYEIRFVPDGDGYRVEGILVKVDVHAPPALQALADLERGRADTNMFPMRLDAHGRLVSGGDPVDAAALDQARQTTAEGIAKIDLRGFDAGQAQSFIDQFAKRPGHTPWPEDLFRPVPGKHQQSRAIPLPNGARGQVSVTINANASGPSGLLTSLARTVVSDLGGNSRITEEIWTLNGKS